MNQCKKFQNMFYEYMDGTLGKADEVRLLEHLETCTQCKEEFAFVKAVEQELQDIPMAPLPENFNVKLRENLVRVNLEKPQENKRSFLKFLPKYGLAVSAAAAFAIMIMAYGGNFKPADYQSGSDSNLPMAVTSAPEASDYSTEAEQPHTQIQQEISGQEKVYDDSTVSENKPEDEQSKPSTKSPSKRPGSTVQKPNTAYQTKAPVSTSSPQTPESETPSTGSGFTSETDKGNSGGGSGASSQYGINSASTRTTQGLIFVIHSTVDSQTLKQLYALPTFQVVGGNRYQMQRSYQNDLIKALKNLEYSIHFSSETSRIDKDAVIIELI